MKVLIDTNVLLSGALRNRLPERVVKFVAVSDQWRWIITSEVLAEYVDVLKRPKFNLAEGPIQQWLQLISLRTIEIANPPAVHHYPRDPKDSLFLAAALHGRADYLITGDKDLLAAKELIETHIVTVSEFAATFLS